MAWTENVPADPGRHQRRGSKNFFQTKREMSEYCKKASEKLTAEKRRCPSDVSGLTIIKMYSFERREADCECPLYFKIKGQI